MRKRTLSILMVVTLLMVLLTACGEQKQPVLDESKIERHTLSLPSGVVITDQAMTDGLIAYEKFINSALESTGRSIHFTQDENGYVRLHAYFTNWKEESVMIQDVKIFVSIKEAFASLYNKGQLTVSGDVNLTKEDVDKILKSLEEHTGE